MRARRWRMALAILGCVAAITLSHGYLRTRTHAWLQATAFDAAGKLWPGPPLELAFFDEHGRPLARARLDALATLMPLGDAAFERCFPASLDTWPGCFERLSRWTSGWVRQAASIEVRVPGCAPQRIAAWPAQESSDWWLWWVPLPHVGGRPYAQFSLTLFVDAASCSASTRRQ